MAEMAYKWEMFFFFQSAIFKFQRSEVASTDDALFSSQTAHGQVRFAKYP